jgi:hypothetical protein
VEAKISLVNVSDYSRKLRITPPATDHFALKDVKYPTGGYKRAMLQT